MIYLLENLGFVTNYQIPEVHSQLHQYGTEITRREIKKIRTEAIEVLQSHSESGLTLSRLIGEMSAATQAIPMASYILQELPQLPPRCYRRTITTPQ